MHIFFHPDCTVGFGITPNQPCCKPTQLADFYRRSGIAPCPEDFISFFTLRNYSVLCTSVNILLSNKAALDRARIVTKKRPAHAGLFYCFA
jgi:hypothetical protein